MTSQKERRSPSVPAACLVAVLLLTVCGVNPPEAFGQQPDAAAASQTGSMDEADERFREAMSQGVGTSEEAALPTSDVDRPASENLLGLLLKGGWLMLPILLMSIVVATSGFERALALRRGRVVPSRLVRGMEELSGRRGGLDPRQAYALCEKFPSAAATVLRAVLMKLGRPQSEIEHGMADASEREASKLYSNVRPLNLATAVTPLMGLLGTVWGMIQAFFVTASSPNAVSRAENLAGGIWVALITTFAGLAVAIPAAILAHYFEGRIQARFREIDEVLLNLLPQLERFEGNRRVSRLQAASGLSGADEIAAEKNDVHLPATTPFEPADVTGH